MKQKKSHLVYFIFQELSTLNLDTKKLVIVYKFWYISQKPASAFEASLERTTRSEHISFTSLKGNKSANGDLHIGRASFFEKGKTKLNEIVPRMNWKRFLLVSQF